jgi:hypothetical protein
VVHPAAIAHVLLARICGCAWRGEIVHTRGVNPIARILDRLLGLLKWPVAIVALVLAPGLVYALYFVLRGVASAPHACVPFLVGAAVYSIVWFVLDKHRIGFWATLEHELTHALFAWATFHRVVGFRATMRSGGHIRYLGRGNWLIAIAPYFFPTLSLIAIAVLTWAPGHHLVLGGGVLGVTVAYHALSTWSETHRHQTDLREVGWLFCVPFLISANAFVFGLLLSYACGQRSLTAHLHHVRGPSMAFFHWLVHLVTG